MSIGNKFLAALTAIAFTTGLSADIAAQERTRAGGQEAEATGRVQKEKTRAQEAEHAERGADIAVRECDKFIAAQEIDRSKDGWKMKLTQPPKFDFDRDSEYFWQLTTNKGDIKVRFLAETAPMHVSSTMYLTRLGFYDDLNFHRVIPGFMAQGGCPAGNGRAGPGYKYGGEYDPKVKHDRPGLLSMANTGREPSDGSQFFLTFVPTPHLDGKHTIFGEVVEGMDNVRKLEAAGSRGQGAPKERLVIQKAEVVVQAKREHDEGGMREHEAGGREHDAGSRREKKGS